MDIKPHAALLVPALGIILAVGPVAGVNSGGNAPWHQRGRPADTAYARGYTDGVPRGKSYAHYHDCKPIDEWHEPVDTPYQVGVLAGFSAGFNSVCGTPHPY